MIIVLRRQILIVDCKFVGSSDPNHIMLFALLSGASTFKRRRWRGDGK
jgi:hypothetical protein